jgi:hypothetical protein
MADNSFKNTALVIRVSTRELLNNLQLAAKVDRHFDKTTVFSGDKVGDTARVPRPVYFKSTDGSVLQAGDTSAIEEGTVSVKLNYRKVVSFNVTSAEMALNVVDLQQRIIKPAMETLAQDVESAVADAYKGIYNFVGTPGTIPSTFLEVGAAGTKMTKLGVPMQNRVAFYDPDASLALANGLKTVFPKEIATKAIEKAGIGYYANFMLYENQSLKMHTVGDYGGTPLVKGASQNVTYKTAADTWTQSLITDGWTASKTGLLKEGDVFTIAGVYSVNRRTYETTNDLMNFVVTADADSDVSGNATLTISPPIITSGAYQNVTAAPLDDAAITVKSGTANTAYRQNLAFHKNAITLAFGQLDVPQDGVSASRVNYKGISIVATRQFNITTYATTFRFDIYFGVKVQNPDFAVRTTG